LIDPDRDVAVWRWDLEGEAFGDNAPNQDPDNDGIAFVFDMRFPGQRYDAATGFNYNYFRDYDGGIGRYVQSDPIGLNGGISTYGYVGGRPLNVIDPSGLIGFICKRGNIVGMAALVNFKPADGVTQADLDRIEREIEQAWTRQFGEYTVHLDIIQTELTNEFVNSVYVVPGVTSSTSSWIGTQGEFMNTHAHEAGHWFELENNDLPSFVGRTIMGPQPAGGVRNVTWVDIQTIVDRRSRNVWKCGCDNN
jgi:RHS repeat-associated protein